MSQTLSKCECRSMLLYGYIHAIQISNTLSYRIPNALYSICGKYYNTLCPMQHFPKYITNIEQQLEHNDESLQCARMLHKVSQNIRIFRTICNEILNKGLRVEAMDPDQRQKLLTRSIYSWIALHIKTKDRTATPPKFQSLLPLLISVSRPIQIQLQNKRINDGNISHSIFKHVQKFASQIRPEWMQESYPVFLWTVAENLESIRSDRKQLIWLNNLKFITDIASINTSIGLVVRQQNGVRIHNLKLSI